MTDINSLEIHCQECSFWFPSPVKIYDRRTYDFTIIIGTTVTCPKCKGLITCNKENLRFDNGETLNINIH